MTTTIDFDALQVSEGPKVTLLGNQNVGGGLVGSDFADFSAFASLSVDVKVQRTSVRAPSPLLTVLVEHSDDGLSWSTAETFTFADDGELTASLASPKAHLRASASASGSEWYVKSVIVAPTGGGSTPGGKITDTVFDADQGEVSLYIIPDGGNATCLILKAGGTEDDFFDLLGAYTFDNSGSLILNSEAQLRLTHSDAAEEAMRVRQLHVGSDIAVFQDHSGDPALRVQESGGIVNQLAAGASLTVKDSGGNPIFRVDENGSVHIKTGTSIAADL